MIANHKQPEPGFTENGEHDGSIKYLVIVFSFTHWNIFCGLTLCILVHIVYDEALVSQLCACNFFAAMISLYLYICFRFSFWLKVIKVSMYPFWQKHFEYLLCTSLYIWFVILKVSLPASKWLPPKWRSPNKPFSKVHQPGSVAEATPPKKTIISPEKWWLEDEISRRLPARLQRAKQRSSWANGPSCNSVCGRHGTWGRGDPANLGKGDLSWSVGWGFGVVCCLTWLGIMDLCRRMWWKCFCESAWSWFWGVLWIWKLRGIDFGLDLGWFSESRLFFVHVFVFFVFFEWIFPWHMFFGVLHFGNLT